MYVLKSKTAILTWGYLAYYANCPEQIWLLSIFLAKKNYLIDIASESQIMRRLNANSFMEVMMVRGSCGYIGSDIT